MKVLIAGEESQRFCIASAIPGNAADQWGNLC